MKKLKQFLAYFLLISTTTFSFVYISIFIQDHYGRPNLLDISSMFLLVVIIFINLLVIFCCYNYLNPITNPEIEIKKNKTLITITLISSLITLLSIFIPWPRFYNYSFWFILLVFTPFGIIPILIPIITLIMSINAYKKTIFDKRIFKFLFVMFTIINVLTSYFIFKLLLDAIQKHFIFRFSM